MADKTTKTTSYRYRQYKHITYLLIFSGNILIAEHFMLWNCVCHINHLSV